MIVTKLLRFSKVDFIIVVFVVMSFMGFGDEAQSVQVPRFALCIFLLALSDNQRSA